VLNFKQNIFSLSKNLWDFILPQCCVLCGAKATNKICETCIATLPRIQEHCACCGTALEYFAHQCGECLKNPPPFTRTIAAFHYTHPVSDLIIALKFCERLLYAELCGQLLAQQLLVHYQGKNKPSLIFPVPLHKKRLCERGYNQALEIARPIAQELKLPLAKYHTHRIKNTMAQTTLNAIERHKNVKHAFVITEKVPMHVAVIDDVITTGSTVREFCRVLKQAGAKEIDVWCVARASK